MASQGPQEAKIEYVTNADTLVNAIPNEPGLNVSPISEKLQVRERRLYARAGFTGGGTQGGGQLVFNDYTTNANAMIGAGTIKIVVPGRYAITGSADLGSPSASHYISITLNGIVDIAYQGAILQSGTSGSDRYLYNCHSVRDLQKGDELSIISYGVGAVNKTAASFLEAYQLS